MGISLLSNEKNRLTSYGLTIVAGLPFTSPVTEQALAFQAEIERRNPGVFRWYAPDHLHLTLAAPLRGRYRSGPPLRLGELPLGFRDFLASLQTLARQWPSLSMKFQDIDLYSYGSILWRVNLPGEFRAELISLFDLYSGFDPQDEEHLPHVSLGYIDNLRIPAYALRTNVRAVMNARPTSGGGLETQVDRLWLIHYQNRTLDRVVGKVELKLGSPASQSVEELLNRLNFVNYSGEIPL